MHSKGVQNVVLNAAFKTPHYQPASTRNSSVCQSTAYRPSKLQVFRTVGDPYTFRHRALQPARPPAALSVSVWPTPTNHQHPSIHSLKTLVGDISPQLMLQPLPLNPLMAPNGGLWFNRYKQFQFSIPLNYGRLEQHAATACERRREAAGRARVLNAAPYQAAVSTGENSNHNTMFISW